MSNSAGGFHQSFGWASFKQLEGWRIYKVGIFSDNDQLVGGAIVHEFTFMNGTGFLNIPEGPILNYEDGAVLSEQWRTLKGALAGLATKKPEMKITHVRIEPRSEDIPQWFFDGSHKAPLNLQPRFTRVLSLSESEEAILKQMKQKGRYNIGLAEKKGVNVRQAGREDLGVFYSLYQETFGRHEFEGKALSFFDHLFETFADHLSLFIAEVGGEPLAAALIVNFGDRATYLYGGSTDKLRGTMGPYALHWEIMKEAKKKGIRTYDLWGVSGPEDGEGHEWAGLTKFKKQFGGEELGFVGAYDFVIQEDLYEAFLKEHEID